MLKYLKSLFQKEPVVPYLDDLAVQTYITVNHENMGGEAVSLTIPIVISDDYFDQCLSWCIQTKVIEVMNHEDRLIPVMVFSTTANKFEEEEFLAWARRAVYTYVVHRSFFDTKHDDDIIATRMFLRRNPHLMPQLLRFYTEAYIRACRKQQQLRGMEYEDQANFYRLVYSNQINAITTMST